ncbi:hypothetical protein [Streptomyces abyssomicinicus]|uniref:hypothetical protein n=1 Tax=Streptomyces abyssomicinicus TaxID=574929 RepID=UPI00125033C4|nr:hypothetical protein [Streptomyces abyssomicinicus]
MPQPGVIPLRPLSLGDIVKGAFLALGRSWLPLLGFYLVAALAVTLVLAVPLLLLAAGGVDADVPAMVAFGPIGAALGLVTIPALALAAPMVALRDMVVGRKVTWPALWERLGSRTVRVLGTILLTACVFLPFMLVTGLGVAAIGGGVYLDDALGVVLGIVGFLVVCAGFTGMIWMAYRLVFAPAITVLEGLGPVASLRRSAALVKGDWWRIFGISYLMAMIAGAIGYVAMLLLVMVGVLILIPVFASASVSADAGPAWGITAIVVVVLLGLFVTALQSLTFTLSTYTVGLLYVDQRIRRENFAEALLASAGPQAAAPPAPPAYPAPPTPPAPPAPPA